MRPPAHLVRSAGGRSRLLRRASLATLWLGLASSAFVVSRSGDVGRAFGGVSTLSVTPSSPQEATVGPVSCDPGRYPWVDDQPVEPLWRRIQLPPGLRRIAVEPGSFGEWLRGLPLKRGRPPVRLCDGRLKANQEAHWAVVAIDVGNRDLQQCADAVIRLRAEFLRAVGCADQIGFRFTSGDLATWRAWREGYRPRVRCTGVVWSRDAPPDQSYASFRAYLDMVFMYAGSASLARDLARVDDPARPEIGDVYVEGGFPGHAVIVVDAADDSAGIRWVLLAQSYMPAQEIHVLKNPSDPASPWYLARPTGSLVTPEWTFRHEDLHRFPALECP